MSKTIIDAITVETDVYATFFILCLKKVTNSSCYSFDAHELISILFHRPVVEKVSKKTMLNFPALPN